MRQSDDRLKGELTSALAELRQAAGEHRRRIEAARQPSLLRSILVGARAFIVGLDRDLRAAGGVSELIMARARRSRLKTLKR